MPNAFERAANFILMHKDANHRRCEHAFREASHCCVGHIQQACLECLEECETCGELCVFQSGRDESISGAIVCLICGSGCQCCGGSIAGQVFAVRLDECFDGTRQILPICKACDVRWQANVRKVA